MTGLASWVKGAVTILAAAAAAVGWAVVVLQDRWLDDLEGQLADARQEAATSGGKAAAGLAASAGDGAAAPAAGSDQTGAALELLKDKLEASEAEREALRQQVRQSETALKLLRARFEEQAEAGPDPGRAFRTVTRTRLRAGPSTDTKELAVMVEGADLRVIDTVAEGTWYEVRVEGYAFHELLQPSPE